jgi:hypothetical protein
MLSGCYLALTFLSLSLRSENKKGRFRKTQTTAERKENESQRKKTNCIT